MLTQQEPEFFNCFQQQEYTYFFFLSFLGCLKYAEFTRMVEFNMKTNKQTIKKKSNSFFVV